MIDNTPAQVSNEIFLELESLWFDAPAERTAAFHPFYSRVARSIQGYLRGMLSRRYFTTPESYADLRLAYPMLVYRHSRPACGKARLNLYYDVLDGPMMSSFYGSAKSLLPLELRKLEIDFLAQGLDELALCYAPRRTASILNFVRRKQKPLAGILVAEGFLINKLIEYAARVRLGPRHRIGATNALLTSWDHVLRRIFPGIDATDVGPHLFRLATAACQATPFENDCAEFCELVA